MEYHQTEQRRRERICAVPRPNLSVGDLNFPRPMAGRPPFNQRERAIIEHAESGRPSWARIIPDYKFDWSVTRDRDLAGILRIVDFQEQQTHLCTVQVQSPILTSDFSCLK